MQTKFEVSGMTCEACVYKVNHILSNIFGVKSVEVSLPNHASIESNHPIAIETIQQAFAPHTKYGIKPSESLIQEKITLPEEETLSWFETYRPILLIFGFITTVSIITAFKQGVFAIENFDKMQWMNSFMAGFFLVFSFFKLLNIKDFASSYTMYDLLAARWQTWGKIYPFVELALGLSYLIHFQPFVTNFVTLVVMGFSSLGVIQSVINKQKIRCACLGAVFNLPMSTVTIIEDLLMVAMAAIMLVLL